MTCLLSFFVLAAVLAPGEHVDKFPKVLKVHQLFALQNQYGQYGNFVSLQEGGNKVCSTALPQLTTEALRRPMEGYSSALQVKFLHEDTRCSGFVAYLTSVRPFPQAEEDTSHRKAKAAVSSRSWQGAEHS